MEHPDLDLAMGMAAAAHGPVGAGRAAAAVLEELCGRTPVTAAALTAFDPVTGTHAVLGATGYPRDVLAYLRSPEFLEHDAGYQLLVRRPQRRARCWRDVEWDYTLGPSVTGVFRPAGYAGGATARLVTRDGRYTGDLHVSTRDPALPTPAVLAALHHVAPVLAAATDTTRRLAALLADLDDDVTAAVLPDRGALVGVPDRLPPPLLLADDGRVARPVRAWRARRPAPSPARHLVAVGRDLHRVRLVPVDGGTLVAAEPAAPPHGLTPRELQVLTLLADGLLNASIARRLGITERTTAHHVEHVLAKLAVSGRTAAAHRAVEDGLRLLPGHLG